MTDRPRNIHPVNRSGDQFPNDLRIAVDGGINEVSGWLLSDLLGHGEEVSSRSGKIKEILNVRLSHGEPRDRIIRFSGRKEDIFHQIAETLWVLGGSKDLRYLTPFLPKAPQFSDDGGRTWRSGYGPRMRDWGGQVDQVRKVLKRIRDKPTTRRAFISLVDPKVDQTPGQDVACNQVLSFILRGEEPKLHLTTQCRSNDCVWGFQGINFFEFTFLQELLASILGVEVGRFIHNATSFHLYERHWDRAENILEDTTWDNIVCDFREGYHVPVQVNSLEEFDEMCRLYFAYLDEYLITKDEYSGHDPGPYMEHILDHWDNSARFYFAAPFLGLMFRDEELDRHGIGVAHDLWDYYVNQLVREHGETYLERALEKKIDKRTKAWNREPEIVEQ